MKLVQLIALTLISMTYSVQAAETIQCPGLVTCEQSRTAVWDKGHKDTCTEVVSVTKVTNERLEIECSVNSVNGWRYELVVTPDGYDINPLSKPEAPGKKP